jgi:HPt (histidine-containing phosphotransfer) domain-containing protein
MIQDAIRVKVSGKIRPLFHEYLGRCQEQVSKARAALQAGDFTPARDSGHRLKGSGGFYGVDEISSFGGRIERAALAGDAAEAARLLEALEAYIARVEPEFE